MAIDEDGGAGEKAGIHAHAVASVHADHDEALPGVAGRLHGGAEALEESLFELEDVFDVGAGDEGFGGGDDGIDDENIFEGIVTGGRDAGALVDFSGIEQVEDGDTEDGEDVVHTFETETALAVEEVGYVGLLESGEVGELEARELTSFDAGPNKFAQIFLKRAESHGE